LPSVGEEEVYKVEERMRDLWIELEGTTGTCVREGRRKGGREGEGVEE